MTAEREESIAQLPLPGRLSFQSGTGYLLGKVGAVARQRWTATLAQTGVSPNQFLVLMALAETGPVCQQFLAGVIGIDPRNIVPVLDSLEARGLVSASAAGRRGVFAPHPAQRAGCGRAVRLTSGRASPGVVL
jgi:hypothetical protein